MTRYKSEEREEKGERITRPDSRPDSRPESNHRNKNNQRTRPDSRPDPNHRNKNNQRTRPDSASSSESNQRTRPDSRPLKNQSRPEYKPEYKPPKKAPITFASIVGKKETVLSTDSSTQADSDLIFDMRIEYTPPTLFHRETEFSTWILYNFPKVRDIHTIVVEANMNGREYYSSFNFFDKLAHFIYSKSDKRISSYAVIDESDELLEYLIKRDMITYKE
jgi:hypothetical protein